MTEFALLCQLVVAGVLTVSGMSKLFDPSGTREAVEAFEVPERYVRLVAGVLPVVELATAAVLAASPGNRAGPVAALLLLLGITVVVLENLRQGRHPECHCFGRLGSSDISGRTVVRNLLLVLMTAVAFLTPPDGWRSYADAHSRIDAALLMLTVVAAGAALVVGEAYAARRSAGARRQVAEEQFELQIERGHAPRGRAPEFQLPALTGVPVSLHHLLDGRRPLLLTFLSPGCGSCKKLRPAVTRWGHTFQDRLQVAVVTSGKAESNRISFGSSELIVLVDQDKAVGAAYHVTNLPAAVVIGPDGELLGPLAAGDVSVRRLLGSLLAPDHREASLLPSPEALTLADSPGPQPAVTVQQGEDDVLVVTDEATGASVSLDRVGALVWQCLDGRSPLHDIVHDIADGFGAPPETVGQDVLSLVRHLGQLGLLTGVTPAAVPVPAQPDSDAAGRAHAEPVSA